MISRAGGTRFISRFLLSMLLVVSLVGLPALPAMAQSDWPSIGDQLFDAEGNPISPTSDYSFDALKEIQDVVQPYLDGIAPELLNPDVYTGGLPTASVAAYRATTGSEILFESLLVKGMDWLVDKVPLVKNINSGVKGLAYVAKSIVDRNPSHLGAAGKHLLAALGVPGRGTIKAVKEMLGVLESLTGFCKAIREGDRATAFTELILVMFDVNKSLKAQISKSLRSIVADIEAVDFVDVVRILCGKKHYQVKALLKEKLGGALATQITDFMRFLAKATDAAIENMEQDAGDSRDAGAGAGRSTSPGEVDPPPQDSDGQMVPPAPDDQSGPDEGLDGFGSRTD